MTKSEYKKLLFNPVVSLNDMVQIVQIPPYLYKYQSFYTPDGTENPYWGKNMSGEFHMSLAKDFEDKNDCKPQFTKKILLDSFEKFFQHPDISLEIQKNIRNEVDVNITQEYLDSIISNYQKNIRIGCFTESFKNDAMWKKYSDNSKGYCIEYSTIKNELFHTSVLPICYCDKLYDMSENYSRLLFLECSRNAKERSYEENIKYFAGYYEKICKEAAIPLFTKNRNNWAFEKEYRMFLPEHREFNGEEINIDKYINPENGNINLKNAISAIYLGENFNENKNFHKLLEHAQHIAQDKKIPLYQVHKHSNRYNVKEISINFK